jgi:hypothetical protein
MSGWKNVLGLLCAVILVILTCREVYLVFELDRLRRENRELNMKIWKTKQAIENNQRRLEEIWCKSMIAGTAERKSVCNAVPPDPGMLTVFHQVCDSWTKEHGRQPKPDYCNQLTPLPTK